MAMIGRKLIGLDVQFFLFHSNNSMQQSIEKGLTRDLAYLEYVEEVLNLS